MQLRILLKSFIVIFSLSSCNNKDNLTPKDANYRCNKYFAQGTIKHDTYVFCGITSTENQYSYKSGNWKFWNIDGKFLAEGEFKTTKLKISDQGGCPYEIKESKINAKKWKFGNSNKLDLFDIERIAIELENCSFKLIVNN